jgi:hypothetical protein
LKRGAHENFREQICIKQTGWAAAKRHALPLAMFGAVPCGLYYRPDRGRDMAMVKARQQEIDARVNELLETREAIDNEMLALIEETLRLHPEEFTQLPGGKTKTKH